MERYDNLVIGGGMSGLPLELRAARHGRTAFVERELLAGPASIGPPTFGPLSSAATSS